MTPDEMTLHRHIYETRLGILGYGPGETPTTDHHNAAHFEAVEAVKAHRQAERGELAERFERLRKGL